MIIHHALRNAMIPVVTLIGLQAAFLLGGAAYRRLWVGDLVASAGSQSAPSSPAIFLPRRARS